MLSCREASPSEESVKIQISLLLIEQRAAAGGDEIVSLLGRFKM